MELIKNIDENFNFNENTIRIIGSYDDPWFVAKDICNILGLSNVTNALRNIPEKWMTLQNVKSSYNSQNMIMITEAAVYKLIMRSNKPIAEKFQEVVCEDILPSLRKKGEHQIQSIIEKNKKLEDELRVNIEQKNKLELENKEYSRRILRKNERYNKRGFCNYIVFNNTLPDWFKFGETEDIHERLRDLNGANPERFYTHKVWYTGRFKLKIENLVEETFENCRVSLNNEFYDMIHLDKMVEFIDSITELLNKYDTREPEPEPVPELIFIDNNRTEKKKCSKCLLALPLRNFYLRNADIKEDDYDLNDEEECEKYKNLKYRSRCKKCHNDDAKELKDKIRKNENYNKKECVDCKKIFEFSNFFKNDTGALDNQCKNCYNEKNNISENAKQCSVCNLILTTDNFSIHTKSTGALRSECKNCRNAKKVKLGENVTCEFCDTEIKFKSQLTRHQQTKACLKAQGKEAPETKKQIPLVNIRSKTVIQIDIKTNKEIKKFNSIAEAASETNIGRTNIDKCCIGKNKTAGGYKWKFET